ncbi:MAG: hypothetical protein RIC55_09650 [Pirellulaceae bacterium]
MSSSGDSPATPPFAESDRRSWLRRLRHTPLIDLVRGRLTGRLDVHGLLEAAEAPEPVSKSIYQLARATRLRRIEQVEVARRLLEQARQRLASGESPDEVVAAFRLPGEILHPQAVSPSRWTRIRYTPLLDLLRGRLTARLSVRGAVREAELPEALGEVVLGVTRRTRLWRIEQVEVARELAEHFHDGLAAGKTASDLREEFGDERQAARLIRRAKVRCRPMAWKVFSGLWKTCALVTGVVVVLYVVLLVRMLTATPQLKINLKQEFIASQQAIPEADRAWPKYRSILIALRDGKSVPDFSRLMGSMTPGEWAEAKAFLDAQQPQVARLRTATQKPRLGYVYGDPEDEKEYELDRTGPSPLAKSNEEENPEGLTLLLGYLQHLRWLAGLLDADARRALEAGDGPTLVADASAMLRMSRHCRDGVPSLIGELVATSVVSETTRLIRDVLTLDPELLTDDDLVALAHELAAPDLPLTSDLSVERRFFDDLLQRIYTDDGAGNGMLTAEGVRLLHAYGVMDSEELKNLRGDAAPSLLEDSIAPLAALLLADRREMAQTHDALMEAAEARARQPAWRREPFDFEAELAARNDSAVPWKLRYAPIVMMYPAMDAVAASDDQALLRRDATQTALALELYRRRHGQWPKRLSQLVPEMLPAPPVDAFDGQPLRYRLAKGEPRLYSVGYDKQDDEGEFDVRYAAQKIDLDRPEYNHKGRDDWRLWPTAPPKPQPSPLAR